MVYLARTTAILAGLFVATATSAEVVRWQQDDISTWTADTRITGKDMREARQDSLDQVADRLRQELRIPKSRAQHDYAEKLLILDEGFEGEGRNYRARLKVVSSLPDPQFEIAERRTDTFDTGVDEAYRPSWVLVVPMDVDDTGAWSLSASSSSWSSRWKVPFRDGRTQFVPATIDADDRARAKQASGLGALSRHLASRYQAQVVLMVARGPGDAIQIGQWSPSTGFLSGSLGDYEQSGSLIELRALYLGAFWKDAPLSTASIAMQSDVDEAIQSVVQGPPVFREVGPPVQSAGGVTGHLQFIVSGEPWSSVEAKLRQVPGFEVVSIDDRGSSVLVRYLAQTSDPIGLLQASGFSWE